MKQILSILLSLILLASHMYLTMGTHFCGGEAVETKIMFGETHLGCGMMDMGSLCEDFNTNENRTNFDKTPCCANEFQIFQSTNEFVLDATQIANSLDFSLAFIYTMLNLDLFSKSTHKVYTEYISPPVEKDIQILFQVYLI